MDVSSGPSGPVYGLTDLRPSTDVFSGPYGPVYVSSDLPVIAEPSRSTQPPVLEYGIAYPPQGSTLPDEITSRLVCAKAYAFVSYLDGSGIDAPDGVSI